MYSNRVIDLASLHLMAAVRQNVFRCSQFVTPLLVLSAGRVRSLENEPICAPGTSLAVDHVALTQGHRSLLTSFEFVFLPSRVIKLFDDGNQRGARYCLDLKIHENPPKSGRWCYQVNHRSAAEGQRSSIISHQHLQPLEQIPTPFDMMIHLP